jgi:hypothetical protein
VVGDGTTGDGTASDGTAGTTQEAQSVPANLAGYRSSHLTAILAPLAALTLLLVLVVPAALGVRMSRRQDPE